MKLARREALALSVAGVASSLLAARRSAPAATKPRIRAVALDAFTTFDPRPVAALAEQLFPGKGPTLTSAWRTRQFEYAWLRTLMGRYAPFWQVTEEALVFVARMLGLELTGEKRSRLMQAYLEIDAWPDARPALESLRAAGIRLALLSNFTAPMLDAAVRNAGLEGIFEPHLSTDRVRAFKPDQRAYRVGVCSICRVGCSGCQGLWVPDLLGEPRQRAVRGTGRNSRRHWRNLARPHGICEGLIACRIRNNSADSGPGS
jgi:2-haloacid dehalogenase